MGRNLSNHSQSPVRSRSSPNRKSPSRRDRSPVRQHKSSYKDNSSVSEKRSSRAKSPRRDRSRSSSPPSRYRNSEKDSYSSPKSREKNSSSRAKSPRCEKSRSPSPRMKRLRRAQVEREDEIGTERDRERNHGKRDDKGARRERDEREHERSHGKGSDNKGTHREREVDKVIEREHDRKNGRGGDKYVHKERDADVENGAERKEKRPGRDAIDEKSSRSRNGRSTSPSDHHHKIRHRSQSPRRDADRREHHEVTNSRGTEQRSEDDDSVAKMKIAVDALESKQNQQQQPSFELSGKLAAETNRVRGVTLLFNEPPDARKPEIRWRLYVFKAGEMLNEPLYIHRQSCYLFGRERRVADIPTDHPSCSKQHAVIQFRRVEKEQADGTHEVRPYVMDLGSTNKTYINENPIEPQRYYELFEKDTIKFGNSSREYVLLHENSAT